jgi:RNA polymerase sigma-70 factor (ECF subfamily)
METTPVSLLEHLRREPHSPCWGRFAELYEPWLRGALRRHGLQPADADDLVQEVMAVLIKEVPNFQHNGRKGAFRTWLRRLTANRLRELWRERKYAPAAGGSPLAEKLDQLTDDRSHLSQLWDREHDAHVVSRMLKGIAADFEPKTWQIFRAFVIDGRKAAEVAAEFDVSEGAVWTAKSHVLKRLRQVAKELVD